MSQTVPPGGALAATIVSGCEAGTRPAGLPAARSCCGAVIRAFLIPCWLPGAGPSLAHQAPRRERLDTVGRPHLRRQCYTVRRESGSFSEDDRPSRVTLYFGFLCELDGRPRCRLRRGFAAPLVSHQRPALPARPLQEFQAFQAGKPTSALKLQTTKTHKSHLRTQRGEVFAGGPPPLGTKYSMLMTH